MEKLSQERLEELVEIKNKLKLESVLEVMGIDDLKSYRINCVEAIERQEKRINKLKKDSILEKIALETKETLESYIVCIDNKLASHEEETDVIDQFLSQWKENAFNYYTRLVSNYRDINELKIPIREKVSKRNQFLNKLTKYEAQKIPFYSHRENCNKWINDDLDHDVNRKKMLLLQRITKAAGEIMDAKSLKLGDNGEINGIVVGEKATVNVRTIYAGGYNIQNLHYRVLVKEVK
ncbi:hypothetical protein AAHH67_15510 [Niallia circulans]